jgi:hypothetical protein
MARFRQSPSPAFDFQKSTRFSNYKLTEKKAS